MVESGVFKPGPAKTGSIPKRASRAFTKGMLKAGNIQLEIHETTQEVGAPHEPVETHLHSEIWLVQSGTIALTTNGVTRTMVAGDVGICVAGDKHYIQNAGDTPATYFVVAVGPAE
jgi:quercetin dioxygenase-like cupin family protein